MPVVRAFISPEEVYPGREVTYAEVSAIAATLNRAEALRFLGFLNLLMSAAVAETHLSGNVQPIHDIQTYLFREVVSESLLADLKRAFGNASLLERPILHRTQLLFAIRLVATHGLAEDGNVLAERADFDPIGDLLFLINGLLHPAPLSSEPAKALWLATHMGPMHELENPPTLELSWPRIEELLIRRLPAVAANREELERLEQVIVFKNGVSIRASIDLSFMFFSFWGTVPFRELMGNQGRAYLHPNQQNELISVELLNRALDGIAVKFDDVPELLRIDSFSSSILLDLSPFRTKPLWVMPDGLVFCVDAALLMERLGPHVFWTVMNGLDTRERRKQFSGTWGNAFEGYCLDALGVVFKGKKWTYRRNVMDRASNEEASDGIASRDGVVLLVECKGTFITSSEKYSGMNAETRFDGEALQFAHKAKRLKNYLDVVMRALKQQTDEDATRFLLETLVVMMIAFLDHYLSSVISTGTFARQGVAREWLRPRLPKEQQAAIDSWSVAHLRSWMSNRSSLLKREGRYLDETFKFLFGFSVWPENERAAKLVRDFARLRNLIVHQGGYPERTHFADMEVEGLITEASKELGFYRMNLSKTAPLVLEGVEAVTILVAHIDSRLRADERWKWHWPARRPQPRGGLSRAAPAPLSRDWRAAQPQPETRGGISRHRAPDASRCGHLSPRFGLACDGYRQGRILQP